MVQTVEKWGSVLKLLDHACNRNFDRVSVKYSAQRFFVMIAGAFHTTQATLTQQMTPLLVYKYKPINSDKFTK